MIFKGKEEVRITSYSLCLVFLAVGLSIVWGSSHNWMAVLGAFVASVHAAVVVGGSAGAVKEMRAVCAWAGKLVDQCRDEEPGLEDTQSASAPAELIGLIHAIDDLRATDQPERRASA